MDGGGGARSVCDDCGDGGDGGISGDCHTVSHVWCSLHCAMFGVPSIVPCLVFPPLCHVWCSLHCAMFGVPSIVPCLVFPPLCHVWCSLHCAMFGVPSITPCFVKFKGICELVQFTLIPMNKHYQSTHLWVPEVLCSVYNIIFLPPSPFTCHHNPILYM